MTTSIPKNWFAKQILGWYQTQGRHDLPWKKPLSAYRVWLSEIMLQQTQVATVIPYFHRFVKTFPSITSLSDAPLDQVLHLWSGLGYYARARNLHKAAKIVATEFQGQFPETLEAIQSLPGIGRSTAGAILAQAFNKFAPILDGNVKRVLMRFHCIDGNKAEKAVEQRLWQLAQTYTPRHNVADYTQAIMDLGATCCTQSKPRCEICPLQKRCLAYERGVQALYPQKKSRKALPIREIVMFLCTRDKQILLEKRPLNGIWAGLWSLPELSTTECPKTFLTELLGTKRFKLTDLPRFKHTFTHFHLQIIPKLVILPASKSLFSEAINRAWVNDQGLTKRGLPAPIKKLIKASNLHFMLT